MRTRLTVSQLTMLISYCLSFALTFLLLSHLSSMLREKKTSLTTLEFAHKIDEILLCQSSLTTSRFATIARQRLSASTTEREIEQSSKWNFRWNSWNLSDWVVKWLKWLQKIQWRDRQDLQRVQWTNECMIILEEYDFVQNHERDDQCQRNTKSSDRFAHNCFEY